MNASEGIRANEPHAVIRLVTQIYAHLLLVGFALIPAYLIGYLFFFQDPALRVGGGVEAPLDGGARLSKIINDKGPLPAPRRLRDRGQNGSSMSLG